MEQEMRSRVCRRTLFHPATAAPHLDRTPRAAQRVDPSRGYRRYRSRANGFLCISPHIPIPLKLCPVPLARTLTFKDLGHARHPGQDSVSGAFSGRVQEPILQRLACPARATGPSAPPALPNPRRFRRAERRGGERGGRIAFRPLRALLLIRGRGLQQIQKSSAQARYHHAPVSSSPRVSSEGSYVITPGVCPKGGEGVGRCGGRESRCPTRGARRAVVS